MHDNFTCENYRFSNNNYSLLMDILYCIVLFDYLLRGNTSLKNVSDLSNCFVDYGIPKHWLTTQSPNSSPRRTNNQTLLLLMKRGNKAF